MKTIYDNNILIQVTQCWCIMHFKVIYEQYTDLKQYMFNTNSVMRKPVFGHMRTAKARISLRILAVMIRALHYPLTELLGTTECINR